MFKAEILDNIENWQQKLVLAVKKINLNQIKDEIEDLVKKQESPTFWNDVELATKVSTKLKYLQETYNNWKEINIEIKNLYDLVSELKDEELDDFNEVILKTIDKAKNLYFASLLSQKYDSGSAILTVICGTGGKDAQDFTDMLARMYLRYAEKMNFKITLISETRAEDVGLKNITFLVEGVNAYGYLKNEHGVHRLVRLSNFNSGNTRETSFAMVDVIPEVDLQTEIEIDGADLKIETFRASGAGGQHVNTTDSAVRITHLPTGIVVVSQNERSQHQNKESALKILHGKLIQLMYEKNAETVNDLRGQKVEMAWGNQIRSYVLHPYKLVKDHRTGFESNDPDKIFSGEIQNFIEAKLIN